MESLLLWFAALLWAGFLLLWKARAGFAHAAVVIVALCWASAWKWYAAPAASLILVPMSLLTIAALLDHGPLRPRHFASLGFLLACACAAFLRVPFAAAFLLGLYLIGVEVAINLRRGSRTSVARVVSKT